MENVEEINDFAWGAALLSFLYCGIKKYNKKTKKSIDGNTWVALCFFLIRIPKLADAINIKIQLENAVSPLLGPCMWEVVRWHTSQEAATNLV